MVILPIIFFDENVLKELKNCEISYHFETLNPILSIKKILVLLMRLKLLAISIVSFYIWNNVEKYQEIKCNYCVSARNKAWQEECIWTQILRIDNVKKVHFIFQSLLLKIQQHNSQESLLSLSNNLHWLLLFGNTFCGQESVKGQGWILDFSFVNNEWRFIY